MKRLGFGLALLLAAPLAAADEPAPSPPAEPRAVSERGPEPAVEQPPIVVWPTLTPAGDDIAGVLRRPAPEDGALYARAIELDTTLRDAVQDLGFQLDVADPGPAVGRARELDMLERAQHAGARSTLPNDRGSWVVSARLEPSFGEGLLLRLVAVPPHGKQLRVGVERVSAADVPVRSLVLLRDLLANPGASNSPVTDARPQESASLGIMGPLHSPGRAVLAANAALFGAFMGYSVQRASGSDDPRLLYPLLTLGTGIGLGAALLVADEWNVTTGDAWTLAAGAWWGAAAGILIANGQKIYPLSDHYAWGVGGGLIGLGLATFSLTRHKADEGDAVLVHSGAGLGLGLGALTDFFYRGTLDRTPYTGSGFGSAIGLVLGGTLSTFVEVSASRLLLIDLGAGVGAAAGAALGSPLVFQNLTETKTRGFLAATFTGTIAGGAAGWWLTRSMPKTKGPTATHLVPYGGAIGSSATRTGEVPAYGLGVRGSF